MAATRDAPEQASPATYPGAESFRALWRAHHGFVWRVLARLGVQPALVDDAAQEVFVVAYRRRRKYDPATPIRSWLYGITRRVAADVRRGRVRSDRRLRAMPPPSPRDESDPLEALRRSEAAVIVTAFLDALDEDSRMVFVLADIEEMTAPEIALALEVKLNTVYSRLRRARAAFARLLAARSDGEASR